MDRQTTGTVVAATKLWWLKINRKPVRLHALNGAAFPCVIKVEYPVDGRIYTMRKWIGAGERVPSVGSKVTVTYHSDRPAKAKLL